MKKKSTYNRESFPNIQFRVPETYWHELTQNVQRNKGKKSNPKPIALYAIISAAAMMLLLVGIWSLTRTQVEPQITNTPPIAAQQSFEDLLLNDEEFSIHEDELIAFLETTQPENTSDDGEAIINYLLENEVEEQEIYEAIQNPSL